MMFTLQIAVGIWLGAMFVMGTVGGVFAIRNGIARIQHNTLWEHPWHRGLFSR